MKDATLGLIDESINRDALISPTGTHRYLLTRSWAMREPHTCFIMLNPSTADASVDDPTIRRCMGFARAWGSGSIAVVNLFAFRATNPKALRQERDPIGHENNMHIQLAVEDAERIVLAWGAQGDLYDRDLEVLDLLKSYQLYTLGVTKAGHPKHPLYLKRDAELSPWEAPFTTRYLL